MNKRHLTSEYESPLSVRFIQCSSYLMAKIALLQAEDLTSDDDLIYYI